MPFLIRHGRPLVDRGVPAAQWDLDPDGHDDVWALRTPGRLPGQAVLPGWEPSAARPRAVARARAAGPGDDPAPTIDEVSTEEQAVAAAPATEAAGPSWWHREHPVFTPLAGFFTGLVFVLVVPTLYAGLVGAIAGSDRVGGLFPFVVITLAVPLALVVFERTRGFGAYMWLGIVTTAIVVLGVGGLVLWYMVGYHS